MMVLLRFILTNILFVSFTHTILDDDVLYDIKWQPELTAPLDLANSATFTSKRKETYSCVLPTPQSKDTTLPTYILNSELESFLQNLHSQAAPTCAYRLDPYWTYELCHGTHVRQYHETKVSGKRTIHQEYILGYYRADSQEKLVNDQGEPVTRIWYKTFENREIPMLSVRYTHGASCDINSNEPRETVVLYMCNENGRNGIVNFQEISSCYYEVIFASPQLCQLPGFKVTEPNQYMINCYPHENAGQQPRSLRKIEREQQLSIAKTGVAQFTMTSADGTTFIISYQYGSDDDVKAVDKVNSDASTAINPSEPGQKSNEAHPTDFLKKVFSGEECLASGNGWWQYQICYGKHATQFHDGENHRLSILLGSWNRDKHIEWITANPHKKSSQNNRERYVSLYYTDGDICELTNQPRTVEVKFKCSKKEGHSGAVTMYLVEPQTCSYVLGVESSLFCTLIDYTDEYGIPDISKMFKTDQEP
ncbi:unnamed protein product [Adineta ricciae]|uniref:Endoplasmic reticulum lectin 1 n=1 Tax=Adineta ricciae TaxID=249248 RepID=A0A813VFL3_ADIRI|nr:unnamed protein product [Adineta ricciae]CAF1326893.1 unnamed protein product [Adineta ricciae]